MDGLGKAQLPHVFMKPRWSCGFEASVQHILRLGDLYLSDISWPVTLLLYIYFNPYILSSKCLWHDSFLQVVVVIQLVWLGCLKGTGSVQARWHRTFGGSGKIVGSIIRPTPSSGQRVLRPRPLWSRRGRTRGWPLLSPSYLLNPKVRLSGPFMLSSFANIMSDQLTSLWLPAVFRGSICGCLQR